MIDKYVYDAFCEYFDVYLELAQNTFTVLQEIGEVDHDSAIDQGQNSYFLKEIAWRSYF